MKLFCTLNMAAAAAWSVSCPSTALLEGPHYYCCVPEYCLYRRCIRQHGLERKTFSPLLLILVSLVNGNKRGWLSSRDAEVNLAYRQEAWRLVDFLG